MAKSLIRIHNPFRVANRVSNGGGARASNRTAGNGTNRSDNPTPTRAELQAQIDELEKENEELSNDLDRIAELAAAPEDGSEPTDDDLTDTLNQILDLAASDDVEDADCDDQENASGN